jgi:hypothetical protein
MKYACMYVSTYTHIRACTLTQAQAHASTHAHTHASVRARTHTHTLSFTRMHAHKHTHTHARSHARTRRVGPTFSQAFGALLYNEGLERRVCAHAGSVGGVTMSWTGHDDWIV